MNRDLERELQARFPGFFRDLYGDPRETGMSRGCEFADGWYRLLERLCEELEPVARGFRFEARRSSRYVRRCASTRRGGTRDERSRQGLRS